MRVASHMLGHGMRSQVSRIVADTELIRRAAGAAPNRPWPCPEWVRRRWFGIRVTRAELYTLKV